MVIKMKCVFLVLKFLKRYSYRLCNNLIISETPEFLRTFMYHKKINIKYKQEPRQFSKKKIVIKSTF